MQGYTGVHILPAFPAYFGGCLFCMLRACAFREQKDVIVPQPRTVTDCGGTTLCLWAL